MNTVESEETSVQGFSYINTFFLMNADKPTGERPTGSLLQLSAVSPNTLIGVNYSHLFSSVCDVLLWKHSDLAAIRLVFAPPFFFISHFQTHMHTQWSNYKHC